MELPLGPYVKYSQQTINFPTFEFCEMHEIDPTKLSAWRTRGWTFQEGMLSKRLLIFGADVVNWSCQLSNWQEDVIAEPEGVECPPLTAAPGFNSLRLQKWPDIEAWVSLGEEFCRRRSTFETDVAAAFAGIEEVLSKTFLGGFCYGLLEFYFDSCLLWRSTDALSRRSTDHGDSFYHAPSWSWLGWEGRIDLRFSCAFEWLREISVVRGSYPYSQTFEIRPIVEWFQLQPTRRGMVQERRIRNDYQSWRTFQENKPCNVLAKFGWKKWSTYWTHAAAPSVKFRYPVPLGPHEVSNTYSDWPPFLRLRSKKAFFKINNIILDRMEDKNISVGLSGPSDCDQWAGILHLNTSKEDEVSMSQICELVAISYGSIMEDDPEGPQNLEELRCNVRPTLTDKYEYYNVIWIRREKHWVLQEAIGRVEKSVWDSSELEDIDVELR